MTIARAEALLIDTDVLIYATDPRSPLQPIAATAIQAQRAAGSPLVVSPQVLREYIAVALRLPAAGGGANLEDVCANITTFRTGFQVVPETDAVVEQLVQLLPRLPAARRRVHDANIVATMLVYGVHQLLTNNGDDFSPFADLVTVVPLEQPSSAASDE